MQRQIGTGIRDAIRAGRLLGGGQLPSSRQLARELGVHRNTVLQAYRELEAEGWLDTVAGSGTFASRELPDTVPRSFRHRRSAAGDDAVNHKGVGNVLGFDLAQQRTPVDQGHSDAGVMNFSGGAPDLRLLSTNMLSRAYRRVLSRDHTLLGYGSPYGHRRLRDALVQSLKTNRGVHAKVDNIIVTRGSQMAIELLAASLVRPGDRVLVESYGYQPAWQALRRHGAKLVAMPIDHNGVKVDAIAKAIAEAPVRALYLTPHHQFPTTVALSAGRRLQLLALCRKHRIAIIEDDYDHEFHYDGHPLMPLVSADADGIVCYVGHAVQDLRTRDSHRLPGGAESVGGPHGPTASLRGSPR